jgi:5-methyltetrahydrofolate--homocysteine methyltransferase
MTRLTEIANAVIEGNHARVGELTHAALDEGTPPKVVLDDGLIAGMNVVGDRFRVHDIFLPDVLLAAKAMYAGMDTIRPLLIRDGVPTGPKVVIGTVRGDLHDIGKNLVGIMLRGAGFEVIDLGNDVAPERMVETAKTEGARLIGMSALLTTTMPVMREVVERVKNEHLDNIKIIVGGAPLSAAFATDIGADAYGFDAANAVELVKDMVGVG